MPGSPPTEGRVCSVAHPIVEAAVNVCRMTDFPASVAAELLPAFYVIAVNAVRS
jgi:hypothetical protein